MVQKEFQWEAKIADVMNPIGALTSGFFRTSLHVSVHASMRDALFLAAWKQAIDPPTEILLKFSVQAALQNCLNEIIRLAVQVVGHRGSGEDDPLIGTLQSVNRFAGPNAQNIHSENDEMRLRAEVLYFFGILAAFESPRTTDEKLRSFEYLAAVVAQKDELLSLTVEEHLGSHMRSVFEYLCSLHYFQSNLRQSARLSRLVEIEEQLQEICSRIKNLPFNSLQNAELVCSKDNRSGGSATDSTVCFLPSAFQDSPSAGEVISCKIGNHLKAGVRQFYFIDSFHHRLRWMERLCRVRQDAKFEALRAEPLRKQAVLESRSGRHRVWLFSSPTLDFLKSVSQSGIFAGLSIAVQEIIQTALEVETVRQSEGWGEPPCFDFVRLVESLAVHGFDVKSGRILPSMSETSSSKFLEAILQRQEIDSRQLFQMLTD